MGYGHGVSRLIISRKMAQTEKKWYVLRAASGKEFKVKEYLDAEIKHNPLLQEHVSQVVLLLRSTLRCVMERELSRRKYLSLAMYS